MEFPGNHEISEIPEIQNVGKIRVNIICKVPVVLRVHIGIVQGPSKMRNKHYVLPLLRHGSIFVQFSIVMIIEKKGLEEETGFSF